LNWSKTSYRVCSSLGSEIFLWDLEDYQHSS